MIFVSTGTLNIVFDRLIAFMCEYTSITKDTIVIQCGDYIYKPLPRVTFIPYCTTQQMKRYYMEADCVVSAAGEGSVLQILQYSKHLGIYFPRLQQFQEHVDNQQYLTAQTIQSRHLGLVTYTKTQLFLALSQIRIPNKYKNKFFSVNPQLVDFLDKITTEKI